MSFLYPQKVLFKHCDPAGIVFYPRYFEMINDCLEEFFSTQLDMPFEQMHEKNAVPAAQIECTFKRPSRHGDQLVLALDCTKLGRSSLKLAVEASCNKEIRFLSQLTIVYVDSDGKPRTWPDTLRQAIETHLVGDE